MMKGAVRRGSRWGDRGYFLLFIWLLQGQDLWTRLSLLWRNGFFFRLNSRFVVCRSHNCEWDYISLWYTLFWGTVAVLSTISSEIEGNNWGSHPIFCIPVIIIGGSNKWIPIFSLLITHAFAYNLSLVSSIGMLLMIRSKIRAISNVLAYQSTCIKNHGGSRLIDSI